MQQYTARQFNLPAIQGISEKQIDAHISLYEGYVKHVNVIIAQLADWQKNTDENSYLIAELRRRFGFEFDGMRNHEYYFSALEGGPQKLSEDSVLRKKLTEQFGSVESWYDAFVHTAQTRGSGWALLYYDPKADQFINAWVDEHHLGHCASLPIVLALDCWEHAYMVDHLPSGRADYITAYLDAVNWSQVEENYKNTQR